jgi:predicted dehydrogenase
MSAPKVNFGWMSTAQIGRKNKWAADLSGSIKPFIVASRDANKAAEFAKVHGFDESVGSYEDLLANSRLEAVYIPLPTTMHHHWAVQAAQHKKHILLDKPCASNLAELVDICRACKKNGLQIMDGVMFRHNARLVEMKKFLQDKAFIGELKRVTTGFSFLADDSWMDSNIRTKKALEPLGCIGDLGWYNVTFSMYAFDWELPYEVSCEAQKTTSEGVPLEAAFTLYFSNGKLATGDCGFLTSFRQIAEISGTQGNIRLNDFVLPHNGYKCEFTATTQPGLQSFDRFNTSNVTVVEVRDSNQEVEMWRKMGTLINNIKNGGSPDPFYPQVMLQAQAVMDAMMESISLHGKRVKVPAIPEL